MTYFRVFQIIPCERRTVRACVFQAVSALIHWIDTLTLCTYTGYIVTTTHRIHGVFQGGLVPHLIPEVRERLGWSAPTVFQAPLASPGGAAGRPGGVQPRLQHVRRAGG